MNKPVLVIMAAGMGSRYGGLKQIDPINEQGDIIMDFSIFDAKRAGFEEVIFIIKKENEPDFRRAIGDRLAGHMKVRYAFQNINELPEGYAVPEGRIKPWGTAHAVYTVRNMVNSSFAVINADDYYGREAFERIYDFLSTHGDDDLYRYAMVGYELRNTVTDNGSVSRGICTLSDEGFLVSVQERVRIEKKGDEIAFTEDEGATWTALPGDSVVSMNMWGFSHSILKETTAGFPDFLDRGLKENPVKCEYFLPTVVSRLIKEKKATVSVLMSTDKWYGITYKEDKPVIVRAISEMKGKKLYPEELWKEV